MPAPGTPTAPTISDIRGVALGDWTCKSVAPNPSDTTNLTLEISPAGMGSWGNYGGAFPGGTVTASGLTPNTDYDARWHAYGPGGDTPGSSTPFKSAPEYPTQPFFNSSGITLVSVTILSPSSFPAGATSYTLHVGDFSMPPFDGNSAGIGVNQEGTVGGLTDGHTYYATWVAVNDDDGETSSMARIFDTKVDLKAPILGTAEMTGVSVTAPDPFPTGIPNPATGLSLEIQAEDGIWTNVMSNPDTGQTIVIVALKPDKTYNLRWFYISPGSTFTIGPLSSFKTLPPGPDGIPCCGDPSGTTGDTNGNLTVGSGTDGQTDGADSDAYPLPYCPYGDVEEICRQCKPCIGAGGIESSY